MHSMCFDSEHKESVAVSAHTVGGPPATAPAHAPPPPIA
jgi:hypothetical protein